jgi:hypothetical protein
MPRRSANDSNIVRLPGRSRPAPPAKLTQAEQRAWRAIVDASPDRFIDGAGQLILRRVVAQIALAERHEQRLANIARAGGDLNDELAVAKAHRETAKSIIAGMAALRATPRSRVRSRAAGNAFAAAPRGRRPWDLDVTAEAVETEAPKPA